MNIRRTSNPLTQAMVLMALLLGWIFWDEAIFWPINTLVVLFHELGHAVAAWITGGRVLEIQLGSNQSGITRTQGGNAFVILNAGYLSSIMIGIVLLSFGKRASRSKWGLLVLGLTLSVTSFLYIRPFIGFGFIYAQLSGALLVYLAILNHPVLQQTILRILGGFSICYALLDIRSDVFGASTVSDATLLAEITHVPAPIWGVGWMIIGVLCVVGTRQFWTGSSS